jgi:hypothetical protein
LRILRTKIKNNDCLGVHSPVWQGKRLAVKTAPISSVENRRVLRIPSPPSRRQASSGGATVTSNSTYWAPRLGW